MALVWILSVVLGLALLYRGRGFAAWVAPGSLLLAGSWLSGGSPVLATLLFAAAVAVLRPGDLRRRLISARLMPVVGGMLPRIGETERIALEAGTVGWDGDLFSGRPDWDRLLAFRVRDLSEAEVAFLDGPVEELCRRLDEWQVGRRGDLPDDVWSFLRKERFLGMIIPEEYGGLGFSAAAHSAVVQKLASRSVTAAVTVMVPNSLGPGELLLHYGTDEQKRTLLPRLATGEEIPCFALTGPEAGSDAAATQSEGIVCRGTFEGREVLGMRLHWRKRYITLAPVATLIGLAFRLRDPEHLLGDEEDLGITCALVPADLPGVEIGRRHDPMGVPFQNGPIDGSDVFVPLDRIIGGPERAGQGWRMLMESLAAGRSISLPSLAVGAAKLSTRVVSAYATVREQFDTPIGRFEGVEEPLARIGALTYLMDAARSLTVGAVDAGERPAVLSAVAKAYLTESMRDVVNDAMDIRAGAAIMRGPRNVLALAYSSVPIGITVEGANILTRSMIIYGQGAIRCHPFVRREIEAVAAGDPAALDAALFGHVGFVFGSAARSLLLGLAGGWLGRPATGSPELRRGMARLTRASAAFAVVSDAAMATLGGQLKRREKITGRLADVLAWLYLGSAAVKRFHDDGEPDGDRPLLRFALDHALCEAEAALDGILANLPRRPVAWLLRPLVLPLGRRERGPSDALGGEVAEALLECGETRDRLTRGIFLPPPEELGLGRLETALASARRALSVEKRIREALRSGRLERWGPGEELAREALEAGVLTEADLTLLKETEALRDEVIAVDAFAPEELHPAGVRPAGGS